MRADFQLEQHGTAPGPDAIRVLEGHCPAHDGLSLNVASTMVPVRPTAGEPLGSLVIHLSEAPQNPERRACIPGQSTANIFGDSAPSTTHDR